MATDVIAWLLAYDNIGSIQRWQSNALCQLVFGAGFVGRALYTNDERTVIHAQRPVFLSGIDDFVHWPDLRDRCVFLHLPPIPPTSRRTQDEFWSSFRADYPRILGAVLDAISRRLRKLPSVHLEELPRMADYAKWGEAVSRGLGWEPEEFLSMYSDNRKNATETDLEKTHVASVMLRIARIGTTWTGSSAKLLAGATDVVGKKIASSARWPKTAREFSIELRRLAPQLALHGLMVEFGRQGAERSVTIRMVDARTGQR
jgi:hypothetical protein